MNDALCKVDNQQDIGYKCICTDNFRGEFCEDYVGERVNILQDDPCSNHDCGNNSTCHTTNDSSTEYKCQCLHGYGGFKCESLTSVTFMKNGSFIDLNPILDDEVKNSIKSVVFHMSTVQQNGILFYWGTDPVGNDYYNFVSVELFSGHVRVKRSLEGEDAATLYSATPINDGEVHKVEIEIRENEITIRLDEGRTVSRDVRFSLQFSNNIGNFPIVTQVGGVAKDLLAVGKQKWFFSNTTSFRGFLSAIKINDKMVDYKNVAPDVIAGEMSEDGAEVTSCTLDCVYGSCVRSEIYPDSCICMEGFEGELCDKATSTKSKCGECVNGKCQVSPANNKHYCQCDAGFHGETCNLPMKSSSLCGEVACEKGTCVKTDEGFKCKCPTMYTGDRCQIKIKRCKGMKERVFYTSYKTPSSSIKCSSLRRFVNLNCSMGKCSAKSQHQQYSNALGIKQVTQDQDQCCRPVKTQMKRIRMKCRDGSRTWKVVRKNRRCGCTEECYT